MNLSDDFNIDSKMTPAEIAGELDKLISGKEGLIQKIANLSKTPLNIIDAEGLRLLLVQRSYFESIVPASICLLAHSPLASGDLEEGALVRSLFEFVPASYWATNPTHFKLAELVLRNARDAVKNLAIRSKNDEDLSLSLEASQSVDKAEELHRNLRISEVIL